MNKREVAIFWFRRDLRLEDNTGLFNTLKNNINVLPIFIFDDNILSGLSENDVRVAFIYLRLKEINDALQGIGSSLLIKKGIPLDIFKELFSVYNVQSIYCNSDYEPYSIKRDEGIKKFAAENGVAFFSYKDQVVFEKNEIVKPDGKPYTVFTPYSKKWIGMLAAIKSLPEYKTSDYYSHFFKTEKGVFPEISTLGFIFNSSFIYPPSELEKVMLLNYKETRDFPALEGTSRLGVHLRFGTVSIRKTVEEALKYSDVWLNELIWREFFMMILYHFPHVVNNSFKRKYDNIEWDNDEKMFLAWCQGETGYPIVDAGMRELNKTGFMHNRVRMITASFLVKHLLIDWRWGEAYFAEKLLDYELSSNNGNWQWAAGTGCDAAPYFRIFNPYVQALKYDTHKEYISKWIPEIESTDYPKEIIKHDFARERCLRVYKKAVT